MLVDGKTKDPGWQLVHSIALLMHVLHDNEHVLQTPELKYFPSPHITHIVVPSIKFSPALHVRQFIGFVAQVAHPVSHLWHI